MGVSRGGGGGIEAGCVAGVNVGVVWVVLADGIVGDVLLLRFEVVIVADAVFVIIRSARLLQGIGCGQRRNILP